MQTLSKEQIEEHVKQNFELTEKEKEEREKLLLQGFDNWRKSEFHTFCRANERFGRQSIAKIALMIGTKTEAEVRQYSAVFWRKQKISDITK